jgi:uncharacterized protein YhaN
MRLARLSLEKYGMFTGRAISFSPDKRVHLVFGPNESGKTTELAAVTDLLYGVEDRTRFNFVHANEDIRIGAEIVGRDSARLAFRRRKGRRNTLLDASDRPLPDGALDPWLAGVSRSVFEHTFGLSQQGLRAGGDAMLQADGEIGRSLFAAASGLTGLANVGRRLREDAEGLFKQSSRGSTQFDKLRAQFDAARRGIRERTVTYDGWRELTEQIQGLDARSDDIRRKRAEIEMERHRLARVRRVAPALASIDRLEERLGSYTDLPELPEDFKNRIRECLVAIAEIAREHQALEDALANADERLVLIQREPDLLSEGARIGALVERLQGLRDAVRDVPKRETEYQEANDLLCDYARRLGIADADALLALEPSDAERVRARQLVAEAARLKTAGAALRRQREGAATQLAAAEKKKSAAGMVRDPEPRRRRLAALRPEAEIIGGRTELSASLDRRRNVLVQRARRFTPPVSLDCLSGLALPAADAVRRFGTKLAELERQAADVAARRNALARQITGEEQAHAAVGAAASLPTPEAIAAARAERDRLWGVARQFVVLSEAPDLDAAGRTTLARNVDKSITDADRIADRRDAESDRLARHAEIERRLAQANKATQALAAEESDLAARRAAHDESWQALWRPAGVLPGTPVEMANWLNAVSTLISDRDALDADAAKLDALATREGALRPAIDALGGELGARVEGLPLALAIREIEAAIESAAKTWQSLRDAVRDVEKAREALTAVAKAEHELTEETERWHAAWCQSMPAIGLGPEATEEEANAALAVWSDVPATRTKRAMARHRADQMASTLETSRAEVAALTCRIAPDLAAADHPIAAIVALRDRLGEAREAETAARQIAGERARLSAQLEAAGRRDAVLHDECMALAALAGVGNPADLAAAADRITARNQCRSELLHLRGEITKQGDGLSEAALRAECTILPADAVAARLQAIDEEDRTLVEELSAVRAAAEIAQRKRGELEVGHGAESAAQEEAIAAAGLAALARNYARLEAACLLVTLAMERHRSRYEDPLIARASQLFARLTGNSFAGLTLDYREDVLTLVAAREDGQRVPISGLSEGTRDQLYLALRLAALDEFAARADPLPFICDDILVSFDDTRAALALDVLAEVGATLQVILFTHHGHIVDLAKGRLKGQLDLIEL